MEATCRRSSGTASSIGSDDALRSRRWRFFQIVFVFTYVGIVLDVLTTAVGSRVAGSIAAYEQNPMARSLIPQLGWIGILALVTAQMMVVYAALRLVYTRLDPRWIRFFNWLLLVAGALRWFAVATAVLYILHPTF